MVKDAEAHAEDDKKFNELIAARNQADQMIHAIEKSLKDLGEKVEADEKKAIEDAIAAAREAAKGDDKDALTAKTEALPQTSDKLMEPVYAEQAAAAGRDTAGAAPGSAGAARAGGCWRHTGNA